jgi:predicted metalloenzyme YecM
MNNDFDPTRSIHEQVQERLEAIIDHIGLSATLAAIADICSEKADHLSANWQDETSAKTWEHAAAKIGRLIVTMP